MARSIFGIDPGLPLK